MNNSEHFAQLTTTLQNGGIAVVRTDTLYGIIALASNEQAVEKVFAAKHRDRTKQCIVLIPDAAAVPEYQSVIAKFSSPEQPTSIVVPATNEPAWLLRGGNTIAYRVVANKFLKSVVEAVGPVIAPSANPEGQPPAQTIDEAHTYFSDEVDCYINGGQVPSTVQASRIIEVGTNGEIITHRGR